MPLWKISPIAEEPSLILHDWCVYEVDGVYDGPSRHFVGTKSGEWSGRVSSRIETFDATTLRGVTASGRVYQLAGPRGSSSDGEYVWAAYCRINNARNVRNVSDELVPRVPHAPRKRGRRREAPIKPAGGETG